ncbi:RidA family protein [Paenibacillus eucommiae]|uniref:2-iminobutanoate/2-iminopropanoate deaminase n=1 Tax=Paenibacillus eucommiae TaxID=1355755 RepID=A0ABS4IT68_9BACL|nr:RidA family protein [Paenibacillus eucommiae]MBP1990226.1 2-iminobutanoate/2-iminopropanoate deaminase [Paenibacillus eucommiae]
MRNQQMNGSRVHPTFGNYSIAVLKGNMLFMSGFGPFDIHQQLVGDNIVDQTHQTMQNIRNFLEDNDFKMADLVRCTVFLSDIGHWKPFNEVYGQYFEGTFPARTVVGCQLNQFLVEIECTAVKE